MQIVHLNFVRISRKFSKGTAFAVEVVVVDPEVLIYFAEF